MDSLNRRETIRSLKLNMPEIMKAVPPRTFKTGERRNRACLEGAIYNLPQDKYDLIVGASIAKRRRRECNSSSSPIVPSVSVVTDSNPISVENIDKLLFETVSEQYRRDCIANFIDATSADALASSVCAICAGVFFRSEIDYASVTSLHETGLLVPTTKHPAHILTRGMLLHLDPSSFSCDSAGQSRVTVCCSCQASLTRKKKPPLSLANGMWIGDVPLVLHVLTLPERILVARYFPAAYIVKLYPVKKGARSWPSSGFHSGIRGNISTYCLNTEDIVKMTDSQIMPPSSTILAATIGVTFVGPRNLPEKTMPGFLRVNRRRVHDALLWLKQNNPIYHHIIISVDRLNELPLDDIPQEIRSLMKHSDDFLQFADENDGYVPACDDKSDHLCDGDNGTRLPAYFYRHS